MFFRAITVELILLVIFTSLLNLFLDGFKIKRRRLVVFVFPLLIYAVGFALRLTKTEDLIDLGYFFTEFSALFVTILFSLCMYLGQLRYWRIKK